MKHTLFAAAAFVVLVLPGVSLAQTQSVATLQQEIADLTAQLQSLEAQLAVVDGAKTTWCYTFNENLSIGMSGSAVTALQTALQKDGESATVTGAFDDRTAAAVTAFQEKYQSTVLAPNGLSNGTGYAGKDTRAELNSLFGCTGGNPITPPIVVNPVGPAPIVPPVATVDAPVITNVTSAGATPTPGSNEFLVGTNLPTQDAVIVIDAGSAAAQTIVPTGYDVGGSGNMTFLLPSTISIGSHTIEVRTNGMTSNAFTFTVVAGQGQQPTVTEVTSAGATPTPGSGAFVIGTNFDQGSIIVIDGTQVPTIYTSPQSLQFVLPSTMSLGSHTIEVRTNGMTSNAFTFTVVAGY